MMEMRGIPGDPPPPIALKPDKFLKQKILFLKGKWVTRSDIIKYVANIAGGVHSGQANEDVYRVLQDIREIGYFTPLNGMANSRVHFSPFVPSAPKSIDVDRDGIDFVLLQIMAAARYLIISPDVKSLEKIIQAE